MIESRRLRLHKMSEGDYAEVAAFLRDDEVMYAWEGGFSEERVYEWLEQNIHRYERDGCGYLLARRKDTGEVAGAIGLIFNEDVGGRPCWEVAYILKKECWGKGYAREGAQACIDYAFGTLGVEKVACQIRVGNEPSVRVAEALGMRRICEYERVYHGIPMPHYIYTLEKSNV